MAQNETVVEDSFKRDDFLYELVHTAEGRWKVFCWNTFGKTEEEGGWDCHWEDEGVYSGGKMEGGRYIGSTYTPHTKETARAEFERWRPSNG